MEASQIDAYTKEQFTAPLGNQKDATFDVYVRGQGAPVVVIQELPGIGQETLRLADKLITAGFQVWLPHLFGPIGKISMLGNSVRVLCMRREFTAFAADKTSPIVDWLKALCRHAKDKTGAKGVGTIGMCLTGNFAISLMVDDAVLAGVASQPSMPLFNQNALHMSSQDVQEIKAALDVKGAAHAFRFEEDKLCQAAKFDLLEKTFNEDGTKRLEMTTLPGPGHSVFTLDFVDEQGHPTSNALQNVIAYFDEKLRAAA